MSTKKRPWREWAVDFVRSTQRCPGEPSFGPPAGLISEEEFRASLQVTGTHPFHDCHFVEDMLGARPPADMQPVNIPDKPQFTEEDMEKFKRSLSPGKGPLDQFKKNLILYVNMIEIREGVLHIPDQLLNLKEYVKKFFDVQG